MTRRKQNDTTAPAQAAQNNNPKFWLTCELADAARIHEESVRRAIRQGRIRDVVRFGRSLRIPDATARQILANGLPM
jgi:hypothetical protein